MKQTAISVAIAFVLLLVAGAVPSYATFSIVAVDTATGEVGGAGASCIGSSHIITDVVESLGAVHTQAYWLQENKDNAHQLLISGLDPDSIIGWLVANDAEGSPDYRQYGVVTLAGQGASAAYTGVRCEDWKGHITGPGYSIQGNILLGPEIVQDMETAFLSTDGPLEEKLMAALEAAKVPGADTRCLPNKSAISSFIRVLRPGDGDDPYLWEVVPTTPTDTDPIDSLRIRYDLWKVLQAASPDSSAVDVSPAVLKAGGGGAATVTVTVHNGLGGSVVRLDSVRAANTGNGVFSGLTDNGDGTYSATLTAPADHGTDTVKVVAGAYGIETQLSSEPIIYYACGNADGIFGPAGPCDVSDLTFLVQYLFANGAEPPVIEAANMDGLSGFAGAIDVSDLTFLVQYLFNSGPAPICE